jgi:hypothetical protein
MCPTQEDLVVVVPSSDVCRSAFVLVCFQIFLMGRHVLGCWICECLFERGAFVAFSACCV